MSLVSAISRIFYVFTTGYPLGIVRHCSFPVHVIDDKLYIHVCLAPRLKMATDLNIVDEQVKNGDVKWSFEVHQKLTISYFCVYSSGGVRAIALQPHR